MVSTESEAHYPHAIEPKTERESHIVNQLGGKYQFLKRLGQSSTSAVYAVNNRSLNRKEALKVYLSDLTWDSEFLDRFKMEAKICASFVHPNIVTIYDYKKLNEFYFFSMLYVDGPSLNTFLDVSNRMSDHQICTNMATICDAIGYAHNRGVIHRDVKASNIMLDQSGTPYITDFGIAKCEIYETQTQTGALMGTPHYVSPEQVEGVDLDGRADIYSLGITLYALLTHRYPFHGQTAMSIISRRLSHDPVPPETYRPDLPPRLIGIIQKALQIERRDRYQTMAELADDLNGFVGDAKGDAPRSTVNLPQIREATIKPKRRLALSALIGSVSLLCIAALLFWPVSRSESPSSSQTIKIPRNEEVQRHSEDTTTRARQMQMAKLKTIKDKISVDELAEASDLIDAIMVEADLQPDIRTALRTQRYTIEQKQEANARHLQAKTLEEQLAQWISEMGQRLEKGDYGSVNQLVSEMKDRVEDLSHEEKTRYAHFTQQMGDYQAKAAAAVLKHQRQDADLKIIKAKMAKGQLNEAAVLTDKMLGLPDIHPEIAKALRAHRNTIKQLTEARSRRAQRRRQITAKLNKWVVNIEQLYNAGDYSACLKAVSETRGFIEKLPVKENIGYSDIRKKLDGYHSKANSAIESHKRQLAEFAVIKQSVADGDLDEAIDLIDDMLAQTNLPSEIQTMLHSQRKIIKKISGQ